MNTLLLNSPEFRSNLPYKALIEFKRLMIPYSYTPCFHVPNRSTTPDRTLRYICTKGDARTTFRKAGHSQRDTSRLLAEGDISLIATTTSTKPRRALYSLAHRRSSAKCEFGQPAKRDGPGRRILLDGDEGR
ncbi:Uncharacterized protein DBV15_10395 [Temnothorax longispinosus]|uniref:Uncharacterized protein n=1 Tax=Temnothorax longispinosus TaxID=300112 RepID=A0A4S2L397_9HYME|nr:Uncharacterized protein DBV15_10395 [Temnothorax longispinosus]